MQLSDVRKKLTRYMADEYAARIADIMEAKTLHDMGEGMVQLASALKGKDIDTKRGVMHGWYLCLSGLSSVNLWAGAPSNQGWAICPAGTARITYLSLSVRPYDYETAPDKGIEEMLNIGKDWAANYAPDLAGSFSTPPTVLSQAMEYFDKTYDLTRRLWSNQQALVIPLLDVHAEELAEPLFRQLAGAYYPHYAIFGVDDDIKDDVAYRGEVFALSHCLAHSIVVAAYCNADGYYIPPDIMSHVMGMCGGIVSSSEMPLRLTDILAEAMRLNCPWRDQLIERDRFEDPQYYDMGQNLLYRVLEALD